MSPVASDVPAPCCHVPAELPPGSDPACPHCDQEQPISATLAAKSDFQAQTPEWQGLTLFFGDPSDPVAANATESPWLLCPQDLSAPSRPEHRSLLGVFLI
ncbi:MAG: hypothetical protein AAGA96_20140 [Verrucomicrobiota bacterium]